MIYALSPKTAEEPEIEKLREDEPVFCQRDTKNFSKICRIRALLFERLNEWEKAKVEYALINDSTGIGRCDWMIEEAKKGPTIVTIPAEEDHLEKLKERETWTFPTRIVICVVGNIVILTTGFILWRRKKWG